MKRVGLVFRALYEIAPLRSGPFITRIRAHSVAVEAAIHYGKAVNAELEKTICDAVLLATCFYWKPVLCLQRAVCTVRLLRRHGIHARLVIGYRPSPFFSHAWVEVDGRVVYGSVAYQKRLMPLHVA